MIDAAVGVRKPTRFSRLPYSGNAIGSGSGAVMSMTNVRGNDVIVDTGSGNQMVRTNQSSVNGLYSVSSIALMKELQNAARQPNHDRRRSFDAFQQSLLANALTNRFSSESPPSTGGQMVFLPLCEIIEANRHVAERVSQPVIASLLRLAHACPFEDVRYSCATIIEAVARSGVRVPRPLTSNASSFLPPDLISLDRLLGLDRVRDLLDAKFRQNGRLENYVQVLALHPGYLNVYLRTHSHLLYADDLPLQYAVRHYIAMMASARYNCTYLVNLHATEFLLHNGDQNWLRGLEHIPIKLRDLLELNKLLAHRPWLIRASHIERLLSNQNNYRWSLSELVHAIVLLTHIHALCSFVFSSGITPELDQEDGYANRNSHANDSAYHDEVSSENVGNHNRSTAVNGGTDKLSDCGSRDEANNNEHVGAHSSSPIAIPLQNGNAASFSNKLKKKVSFRLNYSPEAFNDEPHFAYIDCDRTRRRPSQSWPEQSFLIESRTWDDSLALISSLCSDALSESIEARTRTAYDLTYNTQGDQMDVDTSAFRRAIWNTVQSLYGVRHEDYDYNDAHRQLDRALRTWVKTVACFPQLATEKAYRGVMQQLSDTEKVHVNLMVLEARMQAALLYALQAIQDYRK